MYITSESIKSEQAVVCLPPLFFQPNANIQASFLQREDSSKITIQATGAISWRNAEVKYRKNEAFVDVVETVNLLMSSKGTVLRSDVDGQIIMRAYLSGMPECKIGLNDKLVLDRKAQSRSRSKGALAAAAAGMHADEQAAVELDDCQFHQCVRLGKFDTDRLISFVPPDGEFELMRYRSTTNVNLPFKVQPIVEEIGKSRVEYTLSIKSLFDAKLNATDVTLKIPTPLNTASVDCKVTLGKAKYVPAENHILWKCVGPFAAY